MTLMHLIIMLLFNIQILTWHLKMPPHLTSGYSPFGLGFELWDINLVVCLIILYLQLFIPFSRCHTQHLLWSSYLVLNLANCGDDHELVRRTKKIKNGTKLIILNAFEQPRNTRIYGTKTNANMYKSRHKIIYIYIFIF